MFIYLCSVARIIIHPCCFCADQRVESIWRDYIDGKSQPWRPGRGFRNGGVSCYYDFFLFVCFLLLLYFNNFMLLFRAIHRSWVLGGELPNMGEIIQWPRNLLARILSGMLVLNFIYVVKLLFLLIRLWSICLIVMLYTCDHLLILCNTMLHLKYAHVDA